MHAATTLRPDAVEPPHLARQTPSLAIYQPPHYRYYLQFTDWLVWLDYDLIVKNPHNWFEQYMDSRFELLVRLPRC